MENNGYKLKLGNELCDSLLFIHSFIGCDTTSNVFGIGKELRLKKYLKMVIFVNVPVFTKSKDISTDDIINYSEKNMTILFGRKLEGELNSIRLSIFYHTVTRIVKFVKPVNLPPTSAATKYHSPRTYQQIQVWKGRTDLPPEEWGYAVKGNRLLAIHTDKPPAPDRLLNLVRCKCTAYCQMSHCTCRNHGLTCSPMCGECKGISCLIYAQIDNTDDNEDTEQKYLMQETLLDVWHLLQGYTFRDVLFL